MKQLILLDKAREVCSPANYSGLALRVGVSRQQISRWKNDEEPIPQDRVEQLCAIAHEDAAAWWIALSAERASPALRAKLHVVLRKAGIAALLAIVSVPALASISHMTAGTHHYVRLRRLMARFLHAVFGSTGTGAPRYADVLAL